jgi:fumarate hydratase subunit alpha
MSMRTIEVNLITQSIAKMCIDACYYLSEDVYDALVEAEKHEESTLGKEIIGKMLISRKMGKYLFVRIRV